MLTVVVTPLALTRSSESRPSGDSAAPLAQASAEDASLTGSGESDEDLEDWRSDIDRDSDESSCEDSGDESSDGSVWQEEDSECDETEEEAAGVQWWCYQRASNVPSPSDSNSDSSSLSGLVGRRRRAGSPHASLCAQERLRRSHRPRRQRRRPLAHTRTKPRTASHRRRACHRQVRSVIGTARTSADGHALTAAPPRPRAGPGGLESRAQAGLCPRVGDFSILTPCWLAISGCCVVDLYNKKGELRACSDQSNLQSIANLKGVHQLDDVLSATQARVCWGHYMLLHRRIHKGEFEVPIEKAKIVYKTCCCCSNVFKFSLRTRGNGCARHTVRIDDNLVALPCTTAECGCWEHLPAAAPRAGEQVLAVCASCAAMVGLHFLPRTGRGKAYSCASAHQPGVCALSCLQARWTPVTALT